MSKSPVLAPIPAAFGAFALAFVLVGAACGPCPERESALRREFLCRCPLALSCRLLLRAERGGQDPESLPPGDRASLDFQERALARSMPGFAPEILDQALEQAEVASHEPCAVPGCLACRALRHVRAVLARTRAGAGTAR